MPSPNPGNSPASGSRRKPWLRSSERDLAIVSTVAKLLLFPAYRSTDFEVHRNWLAITRSLPLSKWYYDTTSQWTLDYPPFFAYFEHLLSIPAYIVDPKITQLDNLEYEEWSVVAFQRTTVILTELLVLGSALLFFARSNTSDPSTAFVVSASILLHPGLLLVDHIHFQYNGFLLGFLLWSILAAKKGNLPLMALLFAALLNFKHIFMYLAPPFFVFLLRAYCFTSRGSFIPDRLFILGAIVISVFAVSFGPFFLVGGVDQIKQIFSRLFPFQRGLNHAYWAPNVWALMSFADRILVKYLVRRGWPISEDVINSTSRGLVGDTSFGVLPEVTPATCFGITVAFNLIYMTKLWFDPTYKRFLKALTLSALTSFLFGWHVHEKAVLLFLIPLSLLAVEDFGHYRAFAVSTCAGVFSLFPLMIHETETPIKLGFSVLWAILVFSSLSRVVHRPTPTLFSILISWGDSAYLYIFPLLQIYISLVHPLLFPTIRSPSTEMPSSTVTPTNVDTSSSVFDPLSASPNGIRNSILPSSLDSNVLAAAATSIATAGAAVVSSIIDTLPTMSNVAADSDLTKARVVVPDDVKVEAFFPEHEDPPMIRQAMRSASSMEFLPLMITSVYCAVGIVWSWVRLSVLYFIT